MGRYEGTPVGRGPGAARHPGSGGVAPHRMVLLVVGPVPGLGVFLVIGAGLATFVIGMTALVGR